MIDASPLRCAGERDLGLSVSAWPKLASKGSQRLVSVGRAQAAAAMLISAGLWLVLCERISNAGPCPRAGGGAQGSDARAETFVRTVLVLRIPDSAPAAGKLGFWSRVF